MTTVAVFSSSSVLRAGLQSIIEGEPHLMMTARAATVTELRDNVADSGPDVVVAEVDGDGGHVVEEILELGTAAVILTDDAGSRRFQALQAGLSRRGWAVLRRDASPEKIAAAIGAVVSDLFVLDVADTPALTSSSPAARGISSRGEALTPRESEVLAMMAEGLGNKIIAHRLAISEHTVKFHAASIMRKLDATSRTEAVTKGVRQGLITV